MKRTKQTHPAKNDIIIYRRNDAGFKYKTFEEADKALWNFHPDAEYYKQVAALWRFANKLSPIKYPQGVFKFRSIEEANKHRDEFELAHAKKMQARRNSEKNKSYF